MLFSLFRCWNCNHQVVVDKTSGPSEETRNLMASFNENMAGIFSMLQQMDGIRFARHILEPPMIKTADAPAGEKESTQTVRASCNCLDSYSLL